MNLQDILKQAALESLTSKRNGKRERGLGIGMIILTHSHTPWCRIFFEKMIVTQLVKKYHAFFM
jgi:hypothetical protein